MLVKCLRDRAELKTSMGRDKHVDDRTFFMRQWYHERGERVRGVPGVRAASKIVR